MTDSCAKCRREIRLAGRYGSSHTTHFKLSYFAGEEAQRGKLKWVSHHHTSLIYFDFVPSLRGFLEPIEKSLYHYQCNRDFLLSKSIFRSKKSQRKSTGASAAQNQVWFGKRTKKLTVNVLKMFEARKMSNAKAFIFWAPSSDMSLVARAIDKLRSVMKIKKGQRAP